MTQFCYSLAELMDRAARQTQLAKWARAAFGADHQSSVPQRAVRFFEEAVELYQAAMYGESVESSDAARAMAHKLVDFVFDRAPGAIQQELGGVAVTTLLLAEAAGQDADLCEIAECNRVWAKDPAHFRARNEAKNAAGFDVTAAAYPVTSQRAEAKLTRTQREFLQLAARSETGNPWPSIGMQRRKGGALHRMFEKMKADGLFDSANCITEAGRAAAVGPQ